MPKPKYNEYVKPHIKDIEQWVRVGVEEREIARMLGISVQSLNVYKKQHSELSESLKKGRQHLVIELKNKLVERALGQSVTETTKQYVVLAKDGSKNTHVEKHVTKHPPDVAALQILLKNWDRGWSDKPAELDIKRAELELKKAVAEQNWEGIDLFGSMF
jgi:hypothetical protein